MTTGDLVAAICKQTDLGRRVSFSGLPGCLMVTLDDVPSVTAAKHDRVRHARHVLALEQLSTVGFDLVALTIERLGEVIEKS